MAQGELPWAALLSEDLCCLPFSLTSLSPVDVSFPDAEDKVSMSERARCESSTVHIGLIKLWEGKERREKGEGGREKETERTKECTHQCHCAVVGIHDSNRPGCHQMHGIEEVLLIRFRFFIQHNIHS